MTTQRQHPQFQNRDPFEMANYANNLLDVYKSGQGDPQARNIINEECTRAVTALATSIEQQQNQHSQQQRA
jgi:hypothetical protein